MKDINHKLWRRFATASLVMLAAGIFSMTAFCASSGEETFHAKCAMCHGPDGSGKTSMGRRLKMRDLRSPEVQKLTDDQLTTIITDGKSPMPAYGKSLTSADIQQLVAYIRSIAAKS
jgi:mono/diheme cytochrome c family protein